MKKTYLFFLLTILSIACVRIDDLTNPEEGGTAQKTVNELKAFLEKEPETRTTLSLQNDGIYKTYWAKEDSLGVIIDNDPTIHPYELSEGGESSSATFKGNAIGNDYKAFYPYNMIKDYRNGSFEIEMPSEQSYCEDSFSPNSFPMIAHSSTSTLLFKNLASVLKISVRGKYYIKTIVVEANDASLKLSGAAVVQNDSLKMSEGGSNKVILKNINRTLDPYQTTDFYIVLPPENYKGGLTLTFCTNSGYIRKVASSDILLERSQVRTTKLNLTALTEGDEPVSRLKGNGTKSSPYLIGNVAELNIIGAYAHSGTYFKLTSDISLKYSCGGDFGNWEPIQYFYGYLDGDNHRITDLYYSSNEDLWALGLLCNVWGGISNLTVSGIIDAPKSTNVGLICGMSWGASFSNCSVDGQVAGWSQVGGLIGGDNGGNDCPGTKVENCINKATVTGYDAVGGIVGGTTLYYDVHEWPGIDHSQIKDCINYGSIMNNGTSVRLGGICGDATYDTDILNCANFGKIDAINGSAGGAVGYLSNLSTVSNSYNHGEVINSIHLAGGIVGYNLGTVSNCYNIGYVKAGEISKEGGIAGYDNGIIKHNYWLYDELLAIGNLSGIGSFDSSDSGRDCKSRNKSQMQSEELLSDLNFWVDAHKSKGYAKWKYIEGETYPAFEFEKEAHHTEDHVMELFIFADEPSCTVEPEGGIIEVRFLTNMEVKVSSLPYWIEEVEQPETKSVESKSLYFRCLANNRHSKRSDVIVFDDSKGKQLNYHVLQYEPGYYISTDYSRDGDVKVLQKATKGKGIDIVIMGDIFTDLDIANGLYDDYVNRAVDAIFSKEPYRSFRDFFNVYEVYAVSRDKDYDPFNGISAIGCYWSGGTHLSGNTSAVVDYTQRAIPIERFDEALAIVIMNHDIYAGTCHMYSAPYASDYGSGFAIAYCAVGDNVDTFADVVRHEAGGHGFAKLADEYGGNGHIDESSIMRARNAYSSFGWYKNVDFTSDPKDVIWSRFLEEHAYENERIGVFEGGYTYDTGAFRPTENSIMRYNQGEYNAPSREAIYYRIHKLAFDDYEYSFDEFKNYDRVNAKQSSAETKSAAVTRRIPLAEPVVKDYDELKRILNAK